MAEHGFDDYLDDLIVTIADRQTGSAVVPVDMLELHKELLGDCQPTWAQMAPEALQTRGYGRDLSTLQNRVFLIGGAGISRAAEVRRMRKPKRLVQRIRAIPRSDWFAGLALLVSVIALFK